MPLRTPALALLAGLIWAGQASAQCAPADITSFLEPAEQARIAQMAAEVPYGTGRAYTARRGEEELFLFGTFHADSSRIGFPELIEAISAAQIVLVEMTAEAEAALEAQLQMDPSLILDLEGPGLSADLSEEELARLARAVQPMGMGADVAPRLQPWFAATLAGLPACELLRQARGGETMDRGIERQAAMGGAEIRGLEDPETALRLFADMPRADQVALLRLSLLSVEIAEVVFATTYTYYQQGRIAAVMGLSEVISERYADARTVARLTDTFEARLLDARNRDWMPEILAAVAEGPTLLAAGALHLGGEAGLLRLLEAEGFRIDRVVLPNEVTE